MERCASSASAHLIDLVVRGHKGKTVVEVFIDAEQGVTSDLCAEVSRGVAEAIDAGGWIQGSYRLDVSSPGIDRPLRYPWQFRKHVGRTLSVKLRETMGDRNRTGRLVSVNDAGIVLEPGSGQPAETIFFDALAEAVVKSPW
ncbi:MAG: ribosome maturation factor RimP [Bacteroidota bacterium]